jgi:ElaB/YqjD/DUF883 family membrane-anchored ribosome-binding protein
MEAIDMATDNANNGSGGETAFDTAKRAFGDTAASFTEQATARARDYTAQGKDRAVEALDGVASLVGDAAIQVSEKLGPQYGGYVQQAAEAVSGLAGTLREKDADELIDDARNMVRSSPAIAIAAAAAVGFVLARVVKSGLNATPSNDRAAPSPAPAKPRAQRKPVARKSAAAGAPAAPEVPQSPVGDVIAPQDPPATDNPPPVA